MGTIRIRRGLKVNLPAPNQLTIGEPLWTTDTKELFVNNGTENVLVTGNIETSDSISNQTIDEINEKIDELVILVNGKATQTDINATITQLTNLLGNSSTRNVGSTTGTVADGLALSNEINERIDANIILQNNINNKANSSDVISQINSAIDNLVAGAPQALDTLLEIANKLADDDNAIAAINSAVANKLTKTQADSFYKGLGWLPTVDDISNATTVGKNLIKAVDASSQRNLLELATISNTGSYKDLVDKPTFLVDKTFDLTGKNIITFEDSCRLRLQGSLTTDVKIIFPMELNRTYFVYDETTRNGYSIYFQTPTSITSFTRKTGRVSI